MQTNNAIEVKDLNFSFGAEPVLQDFSLTLPKGSRCLLTGANGAGKSTILRILAGKRLARGNLLVLGVDPFNETPTGVTYLGTEWASNIYVKRDVAVSRLLLTLGALNNQKRCEELMEVMDVNPHWHMHELSDGQRRRVQIVLGLMGQWDMLLLDEVTTDLDVLVRANLLRFLKKESETRKVTIIYATHIFDFLTDFPTHICHMTFGTVTRFKSFENFPELQNSSLLLIVEEWLKVDYKRRKDMEGSKQ
ncbi:CCR4-NOT regulatory complex component [Lobulomyces angularis]|nr:CCR4-NOT regulatory complex component [Lobulomyces angularis]